MNDVKETGKSIYIVASRPETKVRRLGNMYVPLSCSLPSVSSTEDDEVCFGLGKVQQFVTQHRIRIT